MKILLENITTLTQTNQLVHSKVLIENNTISQIGKIININEDECEVIDGKGHLLVPGFIDVHIHLREPGGEHKETIKTGTKAAAKGGFTLVCSMPNTNPVPHNQQEIDSLLERINSDAVIRVLPYASITNELKGEKLVDINSLALTEIFAFTDDGVGIQSAQLMYEAMKKAAKYNKTVVAHCEDNTLIYSGVVHEGDVSGKLELPGIPSITESVQIARDVLLAEAAGCHYHVCHVSTKESVRVIREAKKAGIHVTAEVTPHHLLLNENDITEDDANFKMNPPLRSKEDQDALLTGLIDGTIDFIATDHAPHTEEEKSSGMVNAPFGIVGLETAFSLLYTYLVKTHRINLKQLIDWLTIKPAESFQLPYGKLEEEKVADLTLINLNFQDIIDKHEFESKGKNTPFHGWKISGKPVMTIVDGIIVYRSVD